MRWALLLLLPCGTAFADEEHAESHLVTVRVGAQKQVRTKNWERGGNALSGELAVETWRSPQTSITTFISHARRTVVEEYYGSFTNIPVDYTEVGLRIGYHPIPQLVFGACLGFGAYREHDPDLQPGESRHHDYGQFLGLFTDVTVLQTDRLALVVGGHAELGPAFAAVGTIGIGWLTRGSTRDHEPPPDPHDDDASWTVRLGGGHIAQYNGSVTYETYLPGGELAVGTKSFGEAHLGLEQFEDTFYNDVNRVRSVTLTVVTLGLRHRSHVMRRLTIAWGGGYVHQHLYDNVDGHTKHAPGLLADMVVSLRLLRSGPVAIELFDRLELYAGGIGGFGGSSLFGLAVAHH
jgi:hypothetical protein